LNDEAGSRMRTADFRSDNVATIAPEILQAIMRANTGSAPPYGEDETTRRVDAAYSELFGAPVRVFPVATGTAANALSLALLTPPWGAVYGHAGAHAHTSECGALEFASGGAKFVPIGGDAGKVSPTELADALADSGVGQTSRVQPAVLTLTQATELGTVYRRDELAALCALAKTHRLRIHMDGARFANAIATLGCTPAAITRELGIDVLSFGVTKNGGMSGDAIVLFDAALAAQLSFRLRRAGHVWSKMRFAAVQLLAYVEQDLWLRLAARANAQARRLAAGLRALPGVRLAADVEANEIFAELPPAAFAALEANAVLLRRRKGNFARLVCRFDTSDDDVALALQTMHRHLEQ
jgi:threonine aldolase